MFKNCKSIVITGTIGFLIGIFLVMGTFNAAQGKALPADVEKWLKKNKIGPFQEDKVDYDALYQAAKKEGRVVVYSSTSRGPKSLALGFYEKYPGIKVEWNTIGTSGTINRVTTEQGAGIYSVDLIFASDYPTQVNVMLPANMVFPWVPPDLKKVIPREFQEPLLLHVLQGIVVLYNIDTWPDRPPIDSWWDMTRPEWKGRLVITDPRTYTSCLQLLTMMVLNAKEMEEDYTRVFGKPLKLTTPNAGYEFIKRLFANELKFVKSAKEARYIGKPGQAKPSLGIGLDFARVADTGNPKYGNLQYSPIVTLKPRIGMLYPRPLNIAYKAPHPNAAKLLIRWLLGDEKGAAGITPWFTPGYWPSRADVSTSPEHPFVPKLTWNLKELNFWFMDPSNIWNKQKEVLDFIYKQF